MKKIITIGLLLLSANVFADFEISDLDPQMKYTFELIKSNCDRTCARYSDYFTCYKQCIYKTTADYNDQPLKWYGMYEQCTMNENKMLDSTREKCDRIKQKIKNKENSK